MQHYCTATQKNENFLNILQNLRIILTNLWILLNNYQVTIKEELFSFFFSLI